MQPPRPLGLSYWIEPERLLAGAYPGHGLAEVADRQLTALLDAGVGRVLDLMEEDPRGAQPYAERMRELAADRHRSLAILRAPIEDHGVPGPEALQTLERWLDAVRAAEDVGYVHCWGGRGRTGLAAGIYLSRHRGVAAEVLPAAIASLRTGLPGTAPESEEQHAFLQAYPSTRRQPTPT